MKFHHFFSLTAHIILAAGATGLAAGLHHVTPVDPVKAYCVTGFAIGLGVTAFIRGIYVAAGETS